MWEMMGDRTMVWRFVALPAGTQSAYVWHWLCENHRGEVELRSVKGYVYYYECLEDARRHGYGGLAQDVGATPAGEGLVGSRAPQRSSDEPNVSSKKERAG